MKSSNPKTQTLTEKELWLFNVINQNNLKCVQMILADKSVDLTKTMSDATPLTAAISWSFNNKIDEEKEQANLAIIYQLLDAKANPNAVDKFGYTPLIDALKVYEDKGKNHLIIKKLIEKGASLTIVHPQVNFNEISTNSLGILIKAIYNKDSFLVETLLKLKGEYPIDVTVPDKTEKKWPPIKWAALSGDEKIFNLISLRLPSTLVKEYRPLLQKRILINAIKSSDAKAVKKCIEQDEKLLGEPIFAGVTPLELAFQEKKEEIFSHLLSAGANPNFSVNGKPVLELVLKKEIDHHQSRMLRKLLQQKNINVNIMFDGHSLLYKLMEQEDNVFSAAYLKGFIKRGAQCLSDEFPLHWMLDKNPEKLISLLIFNYFDIYQQDEKGNTFLHKMLTLKLSAEYKKEIIDLYCQHRGDLEKVNDSNETFLIKAILSQDLEVVKHLISKKVQYQTKQVTQAILKIENPEISKYFDSLAFVDEKKLHMPGLFENIKKFVEKEPQFLPTSERKKIQQSSIEFARECLKIFGKDNACEDPIFILKETLSELKKCLKHESLAVRLQAYFDNSESLKRYFNLLEKQETETVAELNRLSDQEASLMLADSKEKDKSIKCELMREHKESQNKLLFEEYIKQVKYYKNELKIFNKEYNYIFQHTQDEIILKNCRALEQKLIKNYFIKISDDVSYDKLDAVIEQLQKNSAKVKELTHHLIKEKDKIKRIKEQAPIVPVEEKKKEKIKETKLVAQDEYLPPRATVDEDKPISSSKPVSLLPLSIFSASPSPKQSLNDKQLIKTLNIGNALFTRYQWDIKNILTEIDTMKDEKAQYKKIFDMTVLLKILFLSFICKYFSADPRLRNKTLYYLEHIVKTHDVSLLVLRENFVKLLNAVQDCHFTIESGSLILNNPLAKQIKESRFAINDQRMMEQFKKMDFGYQADKFKEDIHSTEASPFLNDVEKEYLKNSLRALQDTFIQKSGGNISRRRNKRAKEFRH